MMADTPYDEKKHNDSVDVSGPIGHDHSDEDDVMREKDMSRVKSHATYDEDEAMLHYTVGDPFPVDPHAPVEEHQLTLRALIVGSALGAVVGSSNIYLGLKTGVSFGPQLFGAIFGFAILKPLSKAITTPGVIPGWIWGGDFGPKENVCVQTAATSAGGLGILFVSGIPALYRLNLMSYSPEEDFGKLIALTISVAYFGVAFVIPLRKYFIIHQKLTFPTPSATAYTIRSLHSGKSGAIAARKKSMALLITFVLAMCYKVTTGYAPGMIYDWHIGWAFYRLGWTSMIALENYGWWLEFTPAFFGAGMLSGLNASWSFLAGTILAWGIIAPSLVATGKAVAIPISEDFPLKSIMAMKFKTLEEYKYAPSPRYWLLWPGVLIMLVFSFVELFMSSRSLVGGVGSIVASVKDKYYRWKTRNDPNIVHPEIHDNDPAPPQDRVPFWAWTSVLAISVVLSCALVSTQFGMNVGEVILALILGFLFSFIGVQSSGDTDINPVSTVAKASQLVFGGISRGQGLDQTSGERLNLIGGIVAAGAAAQSVDMCGDLKTGHLIGAKPKVQFVAQIVGSTVASFLTVGLFVLFSKASPCILYPDPEVNCSYGAPSVSAWAAVATAVTAPDLPVPPTSGYTAIGLSVAATITVVVKHLWLPKKYWHWVPNWNAIGLGFVVPQTFYSLAMAFGSVFYYVWEKRSPASFEMYGFSVSAGLLAGEGLGGVIQALLQVAGVAGNGVTRGTSAGCPGFIGDVATAAEYFCG
ncbi:hypothetical protein FRC03_002414 [Tulasnella sp. 419]|nr:hypothetical protein FRC03_002414 [Tulasnella sp. 419]